jgi:hypothetical protein
LLVPCRRPVLVAVIASARLRRCAGQIFHPVRRAV